MAQKYREYVIRCKTCFELVASRVPELEALKLRGMTAEEALNHMKIDNYCTRRHFMLPTIIKHNLLDMDVIYGIKSMDRCDTPQESQSSPCDRTPKPELEEFPTEIGIPTGGIKRDLVTEDILQSSTMSSKEKKREVVVGNTFIAR